MLVFVEDPGAANGVLTLAPALHARGAWACVVAAEPALSYMRGRSNGVTALGADDTAAMLLERHAPSVVLVGTSENERTLGLALVDAARERGIATAGFVDGFANAAFRFRGTSSDALAHCPDVVLVPDAPTRDAFVGLGLKASRILVTGHPHHDEVLAKRALLEAEGRAAVRRRSIPGAAPDAKVVTFVSELSTGFDPTQFKRSADYTLQGRGERDGRTEIVLEELVDALRAHKDTPIHLVVRLHPKNTRAELGSLLDEAAEVGEGGSALDVVFASDLVVGMTSMLLVEASLLGRPTLSIVPRAVEKAWLPTIAAGTTPCATTRAEISREIASWHAREGTATESSVAAGALGRMVDALLDRSPGGLAAVDPAGPLR